MSPGSRRLTRDAILDEARTMIVAQGLAQFSLRRLATQLGVTAPALYRFFDDKAGIVTAIAESEFAQLIDVIERAAAGVDDPVDQIKAQSVAYVECAVANPALFAVMFVYRPPWTRAPDPTDLPLAAKAWQLASVAVEQAIAQDRLREPDAVLAARTIWAAVHGVATLQSLGTAAGTVDRALVDSVVDAVVDGLAARKPRA
jgi:AcrR family transcriptional regulator